FALATTACAVDAPEDVGSSDTAALIQTSPGSPVCTMSGYCECHDAAACSALKGSCKPPMGLYCSSPSQSTPGDCDRGSCILAQTTSPTRPIQPPPSGGRLAL
ncbi:MAG TPA: hypothetical protein VIF62_30065, partial [Labilithrix sp.]